MAILIAAPILLHSCILLLVTGLTQLAYYYGASDAENMLIVTEFWSLTHPTRDI
ncbi:hypothetical protein [Trichormus sp. NMC-1]|uniref:hypothetical protein n=1 Tax=Trichormus sp. NMC-1 TaxID=1853259 RepID=UPI0015A6E19D|nr:hypothetical protein [Trichormus sp. NMC-1]